MNREAAVPKARSIPLVGPVLLTVLALMGASVTSVDGQAPPVQGTLYELGGDRTVAGAAVYLVDQSNPVAVTLTDADGRFLLSAPERGPYRLRIDRIGFESERSDVFDVPAEGSVGMSMTLRVRPLRLDPLLVRAERVCDIDTSQESELVRVW